MEPLTCRGRRGTGVPGTTRSGYAERRLEPRWDWEKYGYWYRVWGRLMYNPRTPAEVWQRQLGAGAQARALESALAECQPHPADRDDGASAFGGVRCVLAGDLLEPADGGRSRGPIRTRIRRRRGRFRTCSPLDPQLFSRIERFRGGTAGGRAQRQVFARSRWRSGWRISRDARRRAWRQAGKPASADAERVAIDVDMQVGLGRFFAAKFRAGVLYSIHERTGDRSALEEALQQYRAARAMWVRVADRAKGVYAADLSVSDKFSERGQWQDRLAGIDSDIAQLEQRLVTAKVSDDARIVAAVAEANGRPRREAIACRHQAAARFTPRQPLEIAISMAAQREPVRATLHYRHVNQSERYESVEMERGGGGFRAAIPAAYTDSPYPLQYYFELKEGREKAWLYPGFEPDLLNQPYFVVRRA